MYIVAAILIFVFGAIGAALNGDDSVVFWNFISFMSARF